MHITISLTRSLTRPVYSVQIPEMMNSFQSYFAEQDLTDSHYSPFELLLAVRNLTTLPLLQHEEAAVKIAADLMVRSANFPAQPSQCRKYFAIDTFFSPAPQGEHVDSPQERAQLPQRLQQLASACVSELAEAHLAKFLMSHHCNDDIIHETNLVSEIPYTFAKRLLWEGYTVPADGTPCPNALAVAAHFRALFAHIL